MKSNLTKTGCPAGVPAFLPRRCIARTAAAALIGAALFATAPAAVAQTAPASLTNTLFHATITGSTGGLPNSGTFSQLFTATTDYNISITGSVPAAPSEYVYTVVADDMATIVETGVTVTLDFADGDSGTFAAAFDAGGTQSGTFELEPLGTGGGTPPLVNISTRTLITPGGNAIGGFTIVGDQPRQVLVRVVGPTLGGLGVAETLANPQLTVYSGNNPIFTNDDWDADQANGDEVRAAQASTGAFELDDGSADAAMVVTLDPGLYTVIGEGVADDDTGEILIEAYYVE
jgi:hypothetical protein